MYSDQSVDLVLMASRFYIYSSGFTSNYSREVDTRAIQRKAQNTPTIQIQIQKALLSVVTENHHLARHTNMKMY